MQVPMLTTVDNPWNPGTHWEEWNEYDNRKGYNTNGLLAKFSFPSNGISQADLLIELERAIDYIVELNPLGVHKKIYVEET